MGIIKRNKALIKKIVGASILAVLVPFLLASEKSMKKLINDWFEVCSVVIDDTDAPIVIGERAYLPIKLYVQGDPPKNASLVVLSNEPVFVRLEYVHDLDDTNRALHTNVPYEQKDAAASDITVDLTPFEANFLYSFRAYVSTDQVQKIKNDEVSWGAFIQFPATELSVKCQVEKKSWLNLLVWTGRVCRFWFSVILVVVLTAAVLFLREKNSETMQ